MTGLLCVVALAAAIAICVEGLAWTRAQRRRLDEGAQHLRTLLAEVAAECEEFGCHGPDPLVGDGTFLRQAVEHLEQRHGTKG